MRATVLVQTIQQLLDKRDALTATDGVAVATAYSELCSVANERLARCVSLVKEGRIVESLHLADQAPALMELCLTLDFSRVDEWRNICLNLQWSVAPAIDSGAIKTLNEAYAAGISLSPLLEEYRILVRRRQMDKAVVLLRRLTLLDPGNSAWSKDLTAFETRRLQEIEREFESAEREIATAKRLEMLTALSLELASGWSLAVPTALVERVEKALHRAEAESAELAALELLQQARGSYQKCDLVAAEQHISTFSLLTTAHGITPHPEVVNEVQQIKAWVNETRRKQDEDAAWNEAYSALLAAIESGYAEDVEPALDGLLRFDRALPEDVEDRALEIVERHRAEAGRRQRLFMLVGGVAAAVLFAVVVVLWRQVVQKNAIRQEVATLRGHYEANNLTALTNRLNTLQMEQPKIWGATPIQAWLAHADELSGIWQRTASEVEVRLNWLEAQERGGFDGESKAIEDAIKAVRADCRHPAVAATQLARLTRVAQGWLTYKESRLREQDNDWNSTRAEVVKKLDQTMSAIKGGEITAYIEVRLRGVADALEQCRAAAYKAEAAAELEEFQNKLERLKTDLRERDEVVAQFESPKSLTEYFGLIALMKQAYPAHPYMEYLAPQMELRNIYEQLEQGPAGATQDNVFWADAIKIREGFAGRKERWDSFSESISDALAIPELIALKSYEPGGKLVYIRGLPQYNKDANGYVLDYFEIKKGDLSRQSSFQRRVSAFNPPVQAVPYCEIVVEQIIGALKYGKHDEILKTMEQVVQCICSSPEIPPLLKVRLITVIMEEAKEHLGPLLDSDLLQCLQPVIEHPQDLDWLCRGHPEYDNATKVAATVIKRVNMKNIQGNRVKKEVELVGVANHIKFVGVVPPSANTNALPLTASSYCELLGVAMVGDQYRIKLLATKTDAGKFRLTTGSSLPPGLPLFAPDNKESSAARAEKIAKRLKVNTSVVFEEMRKSSMWPYNAGLK